MSRLHSPIPFLTVRIEILVLLPGSVVVAQISHKLPTELLKRADADYEGPYRAYPDRVIERRPTIRIYPGSFEDSVLDTGPLLELKSCKTITGLWLHAGPKMSDASSDDFVVNITPGAINDISVLTHLESLTISNVDLTRAKGLRFLKSLDKLQHLQFNNCRVELSDVLNHLPHSKYLKSLRVFYIPQWSSSDKPEPRRVVVAKRIDKLVRESADLSVIFLSTTEQYEPAAIRSFAKLRSLNQLHITYSRHRWGDGLARANRLKSTPEQKVKAKELEAVLKSKGLRRWVDPHFDRTYRLPANMIRTPAGTSAVKPKPKPNPSGPSLGLDSQQ